MKFDENRAIALARKQTRNFPEKQTVCARLARSAGFGRLVNHPGSLKWIPSILDGVLKIEDCRFVPEVNWIY